jgi:hypothetical protein
MKPTFLDYLAEVTIGDLVHLGKQESHIPQELLSWLYNEGYKLVDIEKFPADNLKGHNINVGEGAFASVFIKNDNDKFVLKVARKPDPCWVDYINYARKSRSPHVPRVPSLKTWKFKGTGDRSRTAIGGHEGEYFLAMIERLHPLQTNYDKVKKEDLGILCYLYTQNLSRELEEAINKLAEKQILRPDIHRMADKFRMSGHPFIKVMDHLLEMLSLDDCDIDLHGWNTMIRLPERELVITDPTSSKHYL